MASLRLLAAIQIFIATVYCLPAISFPFNSQLPPVARLNQLFSHSFSPYTFESGLDITYTLGDHPSWLSINSDERRLFGIPEDGGVPPGEVVGQEVEIIATDASGAASMMATVVVCREDGPSIQIPVSEQLSRFGDYSAPSSVLSYPSTDFEYKFDPETFQHQPDMINYYAVSGDSSPLPSWIKFDAASLAFSGQTPAVEALHQPPQKFDVRLVASDIVGFSASSLEFSIIVGSHKLATDTPDLVLNATRGDMLRYDGLVDGVTLDGESVGPGDLNVSASSLPTWLSFDLESWIIEGTPDVSGSSTNFTIRFEDAFSDILLIQAQVKISTGLFQATFDDIEVTPGETFSLDLAPHFKDAADIQVTLDTEPDQDWIELDGLRIEGKVPKSVSGDLTISIEAASKSSGLKETELLHVIYLAPDGKATTTPTPNASARPPNEDSDEDDEDGDDSDDDESDYYESDEIPTGTILLATIVPVLAVAFGIMLLVCFLRRRRSRRKYLTKKLRSKISKPVVGSLRVNPSAALMQEREREQAALEADMQLFHPSKRGYTQFTPEGSTRISRSSDSMSSEPTRAAREAYTARHPPHHVPKHSAGHSGTDDDNRSWFTVAQSPTAAPSEASIQSHHSATAVGPISTNHLLPAPLFLSDYGGDTTFRSGLELTIPSLDDLTDLQPMPSPDENKLQRAYSSITSSSAALPSSRLGSPKDGIDDYPAMPSMPSASIAMATSATAAAGMKRDAEKSASDKDWSTIRETESGSSVPDILPRGRTPLSGQQWASQMSVGDSYYNNITGTYGRSKSFLTEGSFASDENWRVVSQKGVGGLENAQTGLHSLSHRSLVNDRPISPLRPGTSGAGAGLETASEVHGTSSKLSSDEPAAWAPLNPSVSKYSRLNKLEPPAQDWRREDSGKTSEGSSSKVFI